MQDTELYQHILRLSSPWSASSVPLDVEAQQIDVRVSHPEVTRFGCPECWRELSCYDYAAPRQGAFVLPALLRRIARGEKMTANKFVSMEKAMPPQTGAVVSPRCSESCIECHGDDKIGPFKSGSDGQAADEAISITMARGCRIAGELSNLVVCYILILG